MRKRSTTRKKGGIGSFFDDFLKDEGCYAEVTAGAIKGARSRQRLRRRKAKTV
jgi:hypothetical protein